MEQKKERNPFKIWNVLKLKKVLKQNGVRRNSKYSKENVPIRKRNVPIPKKDNTPIIFKKEKNPIKKRIYFGKRKRRRQNKL